MRLGEGKKYVERDWKRRAAYTLLGEPHVPGSIRLQHVRDGYSTDGLKTLFGEAGADPIEIRYTYGRWGTLSFDLFFSIGDNHPNPIVFAGVYPLLKTLAYMDLYNEPAHGAAVLGIAQKRINGDGAK